MGGRVMTRWGKGDRVKAVMTLGRVLSRQGTQVHVKWDTGAETWEDSWNLTSASDEDVRIKVGDSVVRFGNEVVGKVEALDDSGFPRLADVAWPKGRSFVPVDDLLRVVTPPPPSWDDVRTGDTVTFRVVMTDEEVTAKVHIYNGGPCILGVSMESMIVKQRWVLLSIERPEPPLPTEPGTAIVLNMGGYVLHRRSDLTEHPDEPWISDFGKFWSDADIQRWGHGWKVA